MILKVEEFDGVVSGRIVKFCACDVAIVIIFYLRVMCRVCSLRYW